MWSKPVHHAILNNLFKNCSDVLNTMIKASDYVDRISNQGEEQSYMHAMRANWDESVTDAKNKISTFISSGLGQYSSGGNLFLLGQVLHTVMDSTCPAHMNQQTGEPLVYNIFNHEEGINEYNAIETEVLNKIKNQIGNLIDNICCPK